MTETDAPQSTAPDGIWSRFGILPVFIFVVPPLLVSKLLGDGHWVLFFGSFYGARRYDFDLTGVDATIKRAMIIGNSVSLRQTKDCNMKGSAWIAKDDGRMVKFSFDNIYTFSDGKIESTHYEGAIARK